MTARLGLVVRRVAVAYSKSLSAKTPCASRISNATTQHPRLQRPTFAAVPVRWHSSSTSKSRVYDFDAVKSLTDAPSADRILIDVREPAEYEAGYIPTAINIPVSSAPDALFMPADEFEEKFGFAKPKADQELVFYCKAGVRSSAAAQLAQQVGYQNVSEYRGSWLDWQKQGGKMEK